MNNQTIYPVDTVGSFLLPETLITARQQHTQGTLDQQQLHTAEDAAIKLLIESQIEAGLTEVTTGEFRREKWDKDFWFGLNGIQCERVESGHIYQSLNAFSNVLRLSGAIAYNANHPFFDDFTFLYNITAGRARCRQTIPSPANLYLDILSMTNGHPEQIYPSDNNLLHDIAEAYNKTIQRFYELGCRHLQIDDTACGLLCDVTYSTRLLQGGINPVVLHEQIIGLLNDSISNIPADMELSVYISGGDTIIPKWENLDTHDSIMAKALSQVNVSKFFLPFRLDKKAQFNILRHIPAGKKVVLGLIDAHYPLTERTADIHSAIKIASTFIAANALSVSPKTGFKLTNYITRGLTYKDQWDKISQLKKALS